MKKQTFTTTIKKVILGSMVSSLLFLSANASVSPVRAYDVNAKTRGEVKYSGIDNNQLHTFQVKFHNPTGANFNLVIKDSNEEVLFKGNYSEKEFNKTFKFPKDESNKLTFVIEDAKKNVTEQYSVQFETRTVEHVTISKN